MAVKGVTRKVTRSSALSYTRSRPNPIGVTSIAAVNPAHRPRGVAFKGTAAYKKMQAGLARWRQERVAAVRRLSNANYVRRYAKAQDVLRAQVAEVAAAKTTRKTRKGATAMAKAAKRPKGEAFKKSDQYRKMQAGLRKWRAAQGKPAGKAPSKPKKRASSAKKTNVWKRYGKFGALKATVGHKTMRTYLHRTQKGTVRKIPRHAILGFKSEKALLAAIQAAPGQPETKAQERLAERIAGIYKRRQRAAARLQKHGDAFTPNARVIPFSEWSARMTPNKKRPKKSATLSKPKRSAKRGAAFKKTAQYKKMQAGLRRWRAAQAGKPARKPTQRKPTPRKTSASRPRKRAAAPRLAAARSRRGGMLAVAYLPNKRRGGRYRKNPDFTANGFLESLKNGFKLGAVMLVGFVGHRFVTSVIDKHLLGGIASLSTPETVGWRKMIAGALVAALAVPAVAAVAPEAAPAVVGGVATSLLYGLLMQSLSAAKVDTGYLGGYADQVGPAYSAYELVPYQGFGYGGFGQITQAAGGFGQITQAAGGFGQITQAAGNFGQPVMEATGELGEFFLPEAAATAVGEYELVESSARPMGAVDDGIPGGDLFAAERALDVVEAQAGVGGFGDIPTVSTWMPTTQTAPIQDVPSGMRSGILDGGGGIFG